MIAIAGDSWIGALDLLWFLTVSRVLGQINLLGVMFSHTIILFKKKH